MPITGKIIACGTETNGVSKAGKPWRRKDFVLETAGPYAKKVAFAVMNDRIDQSNIQMGNYVEIEADADSREYQGKWYTTLTAWRINNYGFQQPPQFQPSQPVYQQSQPQGYQAQPQGYNSSNDDLPY